MFDCFVFCTEKYCNRTHENHADNWNDYADNKSHKRHHCEVAVGVLRVFQPECFCNECTAAGAEHEADSSENHYERHNKVNCRECSFSDVIWNKQSVNHTVDGCKNHHNYRRQTESQQFLIGEMIRQFNIHPVFPFLRYFFGKAALPIYSVRAHCSIIMQLCQHHPKEFI